MTIPQKAIVEWVTKRRTDLTDEGVISRFELWHSVDGEVSEPIGRYEMETRDEDEDPEDLVQEMWNDAVHDAGTRPQGSYQRYVIKAFRGDKQEPDEAKAFALSGAAVSSHLGGTESPNPRGMLAQDMRFSDNLHGLVLRMAEGSAGQLAAQLEKAREENANLLMQRSRLLEIEQRLLDRSHERQMDREERAKSGERIDMVLGMLTNLAPMILSKLFAGGPMPGALGAVMAGAAAMGAGESPHPSPQPSQPSSQEPSHPAETPARGPDPSQVSRIHAIMARDEGIKNLLGTLNAEQVNKLAQILRPDQAMGFMEVYQAYHEEHKAAQRARETATTED